MATFIPETTLPDGMKIYCLQQDDVQFIYQRIQDYLKNGITLQEGDTVFDVGANIGLFTLWAYQQCKQNVVVYAFEPIPATFEVLHRNVQRFNPEKLKGIPCGLSRESKTTTFGHYPNATALSTAYPEGSKQEREILKRAILLSLDNAPPSYSWLRWIPTNFLRGLIIDTQLSKFFQAQQVTCQLRTVSEIIREHNVQRVDLLKIVVERSELDVLLGIEEQDWSKIKQIFVEVQDFEGDKLEKIMDLLKQHGFSNIKVEQDPALKVKDSNLCSLYALR
jgi:FkbM family methyltransferase